MVIDVEILSRGSPSKRVRMSSRLSMATPTLPTSPCEIGSLLSSRRRHTRYWRDWSPDVCSSDLRGPMARFTTATVATMATSREMTRTVNQSRSEEHTSELQSRQYLVCRLLLE